MSVSIRKLRQADREHLSLLANNLKIWSKLRDMMPHPYTLENADAFIKAKSAQDNDFVFAIDFESQFCGMIGLHPQPDIYRRSLELGYWVGEPYWGKGIASHAVSLILTFAFKQKNINRVIAGVLEHNEASKKVLEKNGFVFEGIARKAAFKNNMFRDEWRYAILKDEFEAFCDLQ